MVAKTTPDLTATEKELLNILQWDFPLVETPFAEIGTRLGMTEDEVISLIAKLKDDAIIRELNAIFDTPAPRLQEFPRRRPRPRGPASDRVADVISEHPGVSHNYKRDHYFNIWFTLAVPPEAELETELDSLATRAGAEKYRLLPTKHLFKIGVKLDMTKDEEKLEPEARSKKKAPTRSRPVDGRRPCLRPGAPGRRSIDPSPLRQHGRSTWNDSPRAAGEDSVVPGSGSDASVRRRAAAPERRVHFQRYGLLEGPRGAD